MEGKIAVVALCFAYPGDRLLALEAAPKDLEKVLKYAAWLQAATYVAADFRPAAAAPGAGLNSLYVSGGGGRPALPKSLGGGSEAVSSEGRKVLDYLGTISEPYVVCYCSGHATNKTLLLPDGSRLSLTALQQCLLHTPARAFCWIFDACDLSGKSLRLPFLCTEGGVHSVRPHGFHPYPTVALSSVFCPAPPLQRAQRGRGEAPDCSELEQSAAPERRVYMTDNEGSLFTSALVPLLMREDGGAWHALLGELSQCCGFKDGAPMCLKIQAYVSDATLTRVPFWMRRCRVERRGPFWAVHR